MEIANVDAVMLSCDECDGAVVIPVDKLMSYGTGSQTGVGVGLTGLKVRRCPVCSDVTLLAGTEEDLIWQLLRALADLANNPKKNVAVSFISRQMEEEE